MAFSIYNVNKPTLPPPSLFPPPGIGALQLVAHCSLWFGGVCVLDIYAIVVIGRELLLSVALAK